MNMKQIYMPRGFTLIEMLVSMLIIVTIGGLLVSIFFVSLRSSTKVHNMNTIRSNGNYAITQLTKMIQFAQTFNGVSNDGINFISTCQTPGGSFDALTQYKYVRITSFDSGVTTFSCTNATIASNSASILDNNTVSTSACSFSCSQVDPLSPQTVGVSFIIRKKNVTSLIEDPTPLQFNTSITVRNLPL
jgi:prepilin-type N-terminal cleavage/methylation domain-containing protein